MPLLCFDSWSLGGCLCCSLCERRHKDHTSLAQPHGTHFSLLSLFCFAEGDGAARLLPSSSSTGTAWRRRSTLCSSSTRWKRMGSWDAVMIRSSSLSLRHRFAGLAGAGALTTRSMWEALPLPRFQSGRRSAWRTRGRASSQCREKRGRATMAGLLLRRSATRPVLRFSLRHPTRPHCHPAHSHHRRHRL